MKQNQRNRFNGRHNSSRGSRTQTIFRNTSLESSGPCGKLRGTALQLHEKYLAAAKDALIQNDEVLAETCMQYADHYMHLQNIAIANEMALRPQPRPVEQPQTVLADSTTEEVSLTPLTDGDLSVLDLSVPVETMNQNTEQTVISQEQPKRRLNRPHQGRRNAPETSVVSATETPATTETKS